MKRFLCLLFLFMSSPAWATFDSSDYRSVTYGAPNHYCDLTLSIAAPSGTGTLGDPWNATRCMSQPVAGDVVGILPGVSVLLVSKGGSDFKHAAFRPANSGSAGSPIVYVTKYAAVAMDPTTIGSNANRTQFRHDGTADSGGVAGTGGPTLGTFEQSYVTYDGFYIDQASAQNTEDSGVLACWGVPSGAFATSTKFLNFVIKGSATTIFTNAVLYRPNRCQDTVISNFIAFGYTNTGAQPAYFSDQYGDQNYLIEKFFIYSADNGIFPKGTSDTATVFNYGTVRYGIIHDVDLCMGANDFDATNLTTWHNILCYNYGTAGFSFDALTSVPRNALFHHLTAAIGCTGLGCGALIMNGLGSSPSAGYTNVTVRDNIFDSTSGSQRYGINAETFNGTVPSTVNYNGYYAGGSTSRWGYNGSGLTTLGAWQAVTGTPDLNSSILASDPFVSRGSLNFQVSGGHAAKTASSTSSEIGAYGGLSGNTLGPDTSASSTSSSVTGSGRITFSGSVRIQ